jgi:hypothetical protein
MAGPRDRQLAELLVDTCVVEDLRMQGTRIELDGEVVQQDGAWLI